MLIIVNLLILLLLLVLPDVCDLHLCLGQLVQRYIHLVGLSSISSSL